MATPAEVAKYYDEWNERYRSVYGEIIQAFRPSSTEQLLQYTLQSLNLKDGMRLLDAGCGYAGPSRYIAANADVLIDAVTISTAQVTEAKTRAAQQHLDEKLFIHQGDFHHLADQFAKEHYDGVFFLESLGHSNDVAKVLSGVWQVLKFGGFVFIKDFFYKETNDDSFNNHVQEVVNRVNQDYCYNVLSLTQLIHMLRSLGFIIEFIRAPKFADDIAIRKAFEVQNNIDTFGGKPEFYYAEWLEIKCIKFRN